MYTNHSQDSKFKALLLEDYLGSVDDCKIRTLEDLIRFNEEHAEKELPPSKFPRAISTAQYSSLHQVRTIKTA